MPFFSGIIVPGHGRGKALGAPTLNLEVRENCPAHGIYAAWVRWESADENSDGRFHPAALHVGPRPTFHEDDISVEVHLLDFGEGDLEHGGSGPRLAGLVEVEIVGWIREVESFDSPEALKKQIEQDIVAAQKLLSDAANPQG